MATVRTLEKRPVEEREQLLSDLYEAHALWAVRFAYVLTGAREIAEDLAQEAFIRAFDRLDTLRDRAAFPGYLRATVLNLARAHFRRTRMERLSLRRDAFLAARPHVESPELW